MSLASKVAVVGLAVLLLSAAAITSTSYAPTTPAPSHLPQIDAEHDQASGAGSEARLVPTSRLRRPTGRSGMALIPYARIGQPVLISPLVVFPPQTRPPAHALQALQCVFLC